MIGLIRSGPAARSFLLGSSLPRASGEDHGPQPMSSASANADRRFARETGPARAIADLAEPVLQELGFRLVRIKDSGRDGGTGQIKARRANGEMPAADR